MARKDRIEAKSLVWQNRLQRKRKRRQPHERSADHPAIGVHRVDPTPAGATGPGDASVGVSDRLSHSIGTPTSGRRDVYLDDLEQRPAYDALHRRSRTYVPGGAGAGPDASVHEAVTYGRISPLTTASNRSQPGLHQPESRSPTSHLDKWQTTEEPRIPGFQIPLVKRPQGDYSKESSLSGPRAGPGGTITFRSQSDLDQASARQPPFPRGTELDLERLNQSLGAPERPGTPERILEQFQKNAKAYKLGRVQAESGGQYVPLEELQELCKDEWGLSVASLYNPAPTVAYDAYLVHLGHTVAAHLTQYAGRPVRVNLRQGKNVKKVQINVTTVH